MNNYLIISSCSKKIDEFELKACIGLQKSKFQTASSAEIQFWHWVFSLICASQFPSIYLQKMKNEAMIAWAILLLW